MKLDHQAIHELLWSKTDRRGCVKLHQGEFALEIGHDRPVTSRLLTSMIGEGRLKKLKAGKDNVGTYFIRDPELFLEGSDKKDDK